MMIQAVRGTKDILPDTIGYWDFVESTFRKVSHLFGYKELRTPIFEKTEVFSRGIGDATDIVNKEMYTFTDKGDESLTLRPEMTAALVRSVVQNSLLRESPLLRLWYFGPFFRFERPQKGRLRQFHQYGAECLGSANPEADAEMILLADSLFKSVGISEYNLFINSLGSNESRKKYIDELVYYLKSVKDKLSEESKNRLETNPLRILDSKNENDLTLLQEAPVILDFLDDGSRNHFEDVKRLIAEAGIDYTLNPRLVRGLDYYNHTVFEFQSSALGAQDSFGGGGRYNNLIEQFGGTPTSAVGFALGIERILLILERTDKLQESDSSPQVYIVTANPELISHSISIAGKMRSKNIRTVMDLQKRSIKSQMKEANKVGAKYVVIVGEDEISEGTLTVKNMQTSEQFKQPITSIENFNFE
ncbi:MAG: histidine--tRNA ligase [Ignavibacteria bacterium GWB2_35_12]|nr:MAG: histidine--tRNA ligase [Ignavibacteria bacterium GWA2_35_8]OGU40607.1 MAG: histidine--tRNA ligase [Ignavibacteria bacterium GWB2_35_12]OGU91671.1 MAG: histidine--tRNA ligase [Ignavibacteria bacterium RIFOXYA2_FULL_35_10]OGV22641.1 MAG: histidine--tRNA ligase [Ignavibacteria bacterium RIFOXYC2_FULL_35_21]